MGTDIAIDVGTSRTRLFIPGKGIVTDEPSVVTVDLQTNRSIAFGESAYKMLGKTSERYCVMYPLNGGVVSDFDVVQDMLDYFFKKVGQGRLTMPRVVACIPSEITEVEKRAIVNSISAIGVRNVFLIEEPVAAAIGFGIEIGSPQGFFIIDIGGGTSDMAVITLSGIATSRSIKVAGNSFDDEIMKYLKTNYNLLIGKQTAEKIKIEIGTVIQTEPQKIFCAKGRDCLTGMPRSVDITSNELIDILVPQVNKIIRNIKAVLEETDPELIGDIFSGGIHLSGGSSKLRGIDVLIQQHTGLPVHLADDPANNVIYGTGASIKYIGDLVNKSYGAMNPLSDEF